MSEIRVNKVINEAGTGAVELTQGATLPSGKTISGAGAINVTGTVTAASGSFTGNVSVGGTLTYEDVTNIDSLGIITGRSALHVAGISSFAGETRTTTISEKSVRINGNTATLTYAGSSANVAICTNPSGDITLNVNSIPTDSTFDNHTLTFAVIVNSTGTARTCTAVNLNGVSKTIKWAGGSFTNALSGVTTTNGYTVQSFSGINTVGSASTTNNYEVFGVVSGGFF
jgi:hypothetical protein